MLVKKIAQIFCCFLLFFNVFGQASPQLNGEPINQAYLEHLIKIKVDEVRKSNKCNPLINDSILYVASSFHSNYLKEIKRLSHYQENAPRTRTPQLRTEFFGAVNYAVSENVLVTPFGTNVKGKDGSIFDTRTYEGVANAIVSGWVNSPGHFKNMIDTRPQITGLAITIDTVNKRIYACQKFAHVSYKYDFAESKDLFKYSTYTPAPIPNSFDGVGRELIPHKYAYKLRHDKSEYCIDCELALAFEETPHLTLRLEGNYFILKVEDSEYVKRMIRNSNDGFAVEIVTFDDYMCGNPDYYTRPSRRNGQLKLNGDLLEPLYRKDLIKGFKKRKKRPNVKFIPYIFKSDSISFFKRFGRYKTDKFSSEYFEIKLGKVPKNQTGYWAHNLIYIQQRQICHTSYFTSFCGETFEEYQETDFIPLNPEGNYDFQAENKTLQFTIPFQQGKHEFSPNDIRPFINELTNLHYSIDSVHIKAFSSVEGDSIINAKLQEKRARGIINVLREIHPDTIAFQTKITTVSDWAGFKKEIAKNAEYNHLSRVSEAELYEKLKKIEHSVLEPYLEKGRRGEISIYYRIQPSEDNLEYFVKKELTLFKSSLDEAVSNVEKYKELLSSFAKLYRYIHKLVRLDKLPPSFMANVIMPQRFESNGELAQQYILIGHEFEEEFKENRFWIANNVAIENALFHTKNLRFIPEFSYYSVRKSIQQFVEGKKGDDNLIQKQFSRLTSLKNFYASNPVVAENITKLNFNANVLLVNYYYSLNTVEHASDGIKSLLQLYEFYTKRDLLNVDLNNRLARCAIHFHDINLAVDMLKSYYSDDEALNFLMPLMYQHPSSIGASTYYQELIDLSKTMNTTIWCNMFMGECKIPFQAFDHEELRNQFCEKCLNENSVLKKITGH